MDGRTVSSPIPALPSGGRPTRAGTLLGPAILIPLLVQFDSCALRKEWFQFNAFGLALATLGSILVVALGLYPGELAKVLRGAQGLILGFGTLAVLALFGAVLPEANLDDGGKYIYYPTADAILFTLSIGASVMCREELTWRIAMIAAMLAIVGSIVCDSIYPGTFSELTTRAAGFGVNPNTGGAIVAILLIGLLTWDRPGFHPLAVASLAVSGIGVFLTLSRSSLLCWGVVAAGYTLRSMIQRGASAGLSMTIVGVPLAVLAIGAGDRIREAFPMLQSSHQRIEAFLGGGDMDHADDSRIHLAEEFYELAMESPWTGWGTGLNYATESGAHNIFLAKWVENGLLALLTVLILIFATYQLGRRTGSMEAKLLAAFIFVQGFFSHNMFEDKTLLIMWGVIAGRAVLRESARNVSSQQSPPPPVRRQPQRLRLASPLNADAA